MPDSSAARAQTAAARRFLTFRASGRVYALPAGIVGEIIDMPAVTRVPQGPPCLLGIANLRGNVLPVVALNRLLDLGEASDSPCRRAIVIDSDAPLALAVDQVDGLVAVDEDRIETREAELSAENGERLAGADSTMAKTRLGY